MSVFQSVDTDRRFASCLRKRAITVSCEAVRNYRRMWKRLKLGEQPRPVEESRIELRLVTIAFRLPNVS